MKIVAVYKWARDPEDAVVRSDGSIDWRGAKMTAGEDDPAVLTAAHDIAAGSGGTVTGLTIGDGDPTWALARGVEQALSVPDAPFVLDNAATASLLAAAIRAIGEVDVVVIGDAEAYPGVAPTIAGILGWPVLLGVSTAAACGGRLRATRRAGSLEQRISIAPPAVLGVAAAGAEKQAPGMKEVLAARKRPVRVMSLEEIGSAPSERVTSRSTHVPTSGAARIFEGDPATAAAELVAALRADGVL